MAQLTKQALIVENNQSFPNNNVGAITPTILREFNTDIIDSTVNQTIYTADSASWNNKIDGLSTGSAMITGSVDGAILTFTKGDGTTFDLAVTASVGSVAWDNVTDKPSGLVSGSSQVVDILTSVNAFTQSQESKDSTLATYTGSVDTKFATIGSQSGSWVNTALNAFTASQETKNTTLGGVTASLQQQLTNIGSQSGSWVTESETGSFARTNVSNTFTADQTINGTLNVTTLNATTIHTIIESSSVIYSSGSNQFGDELTDTQTLSGSVKVVGSLTVNGVNVITSSVDISALNSFTASQEILNDTFATTGSNIFNGNQTITGSLLISGNEVVVGEVTSSRLRVNSSTSLGGTLSVAFDTIMRGDLTIESTSPQIKLRDNGAGGFTSGYDIRVDTGSFEIYDDTHNRDVLSDFFNSGSQKHTTSLTSEIIVISGSDSVTLIGNVSAANAVTANGAITANSGIQVLNGSGIDLKGNVEGSGSAYISVTSTVDVTSDPTNVYSSYQLVKEGGEPLIAIAANSYTAEYPGITIPYLFGGGNNPNGTNAGIAFPTSGDMDVWKKTIFNYGINVTGSTEVGSFTSSLQQGYAFVGGANGRTTTVPTSSFGGSGSPTDISALNAFTASQETKNSTLATYTGSIDTKFNTIGTQSGSWENVPLTSLNAFTASQQVLNLQFASTSSNSFTGNQNIINGSTLSVEGTITALGGVRVLNGSGIDVQSNAEGSGSAFSSISVRVDALSDPTNVYSGIQLIKENGDSLINLAVNSYSPQYGTATPMILADGNNPDGNNTAIGFTPDGKMDVWKNTSFKYSAEITGSLVVSGSMNSSVIPLTITSNTASLNASTGNTFQLNLVSGSATRLEVSGAKSGQTINLLVSQSATGPGTLTFGTNIEQPSGSFYSASQVASGEDILTMATFINPNRIYLANIKNFI